MTLNLGRVSDKLYNEDLAPTSPEQRNWGTYQIFALWMSDIHSVGGYVFAAGLFFLGLTGWQVLACLVLGIFIVNHFINLMGEPGQKYGIPYAVMARVSFGVFGANLPALIRAVIGIIWYGVQTWLASEAVVILCVAVNPNLARYTTDSFLGLSTLGWAAFLFMWFFQMVIFYRGIDTIRKFIDFCGPAVYVVMFALAIWIFSRAGSDSLRLNLSDHSLNTWETVYTMLTAVSLVVAYFAALLLNFGDFSRFTVSMKTMKRGNFWGLPVNFLLFSLVTVVVTAGTVPVFGEAVLDPVQIVGKIPNKFALILGCITFIIATMGINIVANFVSPAYDLANLFPKHINFRRGGLLTSFLAVLILPWHLFNSPLIINYFVGALGAFLGPLYGVMIADYYRIRKSRIEVQDLYEADPNGTYYYKEGWNPVAVQALVPATVIAGVTALVPALHLIAPFSWFIGAGLGWLFYLMLSRRRERTI